ncbi:GNAT family N-acetyltransferase [Spongiivirga citrea]|uniref:GNAT family N-acetyltransferase n=1 Tax=Spongiivirga citrea TaxID=1481457 RepID=A0A6M0CF46_9FLAO|nr:GNAT family protein [Spongiivirga citrea]NER16465.1 GNAT family N-acetyltransferase [Spongiivirga citrea]
MNAFEILEDAVAKLIPLSEPHFALLWPIAKQLDLYEYGPSDISIPEKLTSYLDAAIQQRAIGTSIPFVIEDKRTNEIVGCTRFGLIDTGNKVLHIGWTWIAPAVQGTGLNTHVKHLMLNHAFNQLEFEKVEFRIDERNIRSRKAVQKLGAQLEGILRECVYVKNGFKRSSCCYGILKSEWSARS